jgi:proteasome accessory factor A
LNGKKRDRQSKEKRRICGLETEYGLVFIGSENSDLNIARNWNDESLGTVEKELFENLNGLARVSKNFYRESGRSDDFFSRNGGRIYLDRGHHPETSTPECVSPKETVLYDKAAERLLEKALAKTNKKFLAGQKLFLFKNNTHGENNTFGCHENYGYRAKTDFNKDIVPVLIPFLITRQIFCGSGKIWGNRFEISQRAKFIKNTVSSGTTDDNWRMGNSRPIINKRTQEDSNDWDGALANSRLWQRLHLILGDSNMSEYTAWLKMGTTALVLRMIEDGFIKWRIETADYAPWVYRRISRDLTCRQKIEVIFSEAEGKNGIRRRLSPAEIQELYLKEAEKFLKERKTLFSAGNFREFGEIVAEWGSVLEKIKTNPMLLKREIDWVIKKNLLDEYRKKKKVKRHTAALKMIDLQYHNIDRSQGLYYFLEKEGLARRLFCDREIEKAIAEPPSDTRAKWRGLIISFCEDSGIYYKANWIEFYFPVTSVKLINSREIKCFNPFHAPAKLPKWLVRELKRRINK